MLELLGQCVLLIALLIVFLWLVHKGMNVHKGE